MQFDPFTIPREERQKIKQELLETFKDKRIELLSMRDDPHPVPIGTRGTVRFVDDILTIHVDWDNGSKLGVIYMVDDIRLVDEESEADRKHRASCNSAGYSLFEEWDGIDPESRRRFLTELHIKDIPANPSTAWVKDNLTVEQIDELAVLWFG